MNKLDDVIAERSISIERILNAPRDLVWKVWTEPDHIKKWWGPNGFTNTIHKMEVKNGGEWDFIMHGPDGTNYKNKIVYIDVRKPERLVYDHVSGPVFHVTVNFEELGSKTKINMRMIFDTVEERERTIEKFGAVEGLKQTIAKLESYLVNI